VIEEEVRQATLHSEITKDKYFEEADGRRHYLSECVESAKKKAARKSVCSFIK
jgi:hypothetical protein